jgi:hypothetical protein
MTENTDHPEFQPILEQADSKGSLPDRELKTHPKTYFRSDLMSEAKNLRFQIASRQKGTIG